MDPWPPEGFEAIMEDALQLIAKHGMHCELLDLLVLIMPLDVLEDQVPMGRNLLLALEETGIRYARVF